MNGLRKVVSLLDDVGVFSRWINLVGAVAVISMVALTFIDVILRYIFDSPITGAKEITEVMLIIAVFLSVARTYSFRGHVHVDVVTGKLGPKSNLILDFTTTIMGLGLFSCVVWRMFLLTRVFFEKGNIQHQFEILTWPFAAVICFGSLIMALLMIRDILRDLVQAEKLGFNRYQWLLMIGIPVVVIVLAALWVQPDLWQISLPVLGFIGLIVFLIFLLSGMPISFALFIPGLLFLAHIRGMTPAMNTLSREIYATTGDFVWATVAFFVLMGFFCLHARFGEDLYVLFNRWLGRLPGGLAIATTGSCTGFAAIVGDSVSSIATMTSIAMPEMKKYKYDDRLSTGSIAGGSLIGPIIPPSIPFIIYGALTQLSIGKLFIAGIFPGVLLGIAFMATIYIWCRMNPQLGPKVEGKVSWRERLVSLKGIGPIMLLFILVIGGIYAGVFSPTEGGGIGAAGALILGLVMRRFTWKRFSQALLDGCRVLSMILLIINGAILFTRFVAWCNISGIVRDAFVGLGIPPTAVIILILFIFLILGFVVDVLTLNLIGVPIMHPIAVSLGADPIWFATLVVLIFTLGALTPPVGINLFTMKGMAPDIPIGTIYRGAFPFVAAAVIAIVIVFLVPPIASWLPSLL